MTRQLADRQTALMQAIARKLRAEAEPEARREICLQPSWGHTMGERVRHRQHGPEYEVLGVGERLIAYAPVMAGSKLAVYRGEDDKLWGREVGEFRDGRFETIRPAPDRELIAQVLEGAAEQVAGEAVRRPSNERAVEQARRTAIYRRSTAALRELRPRGARHG